MQVGPLTEQEQGILPCCNLRSQANGAEGSMELSGQLRELCRDYIDFDITWCGLHHLVMPLPSGYRDGTTNEYQ